MTCPFVALLPKLPALMLGVTKATSPKLQEAGGVGSGGIRGSRIVSTDLSKVRRQRLKGVESPYIVDARLVMIT